jgi:hypothetical protein
MRPSIPEGFGLALHQNIYKEHECIECFAQLQRGVLQRLCVTLGCSETAKSRF